MGRLVGKLGRLRLMWGGSGCGEAVGKLWGNWASRAERARTQPKLLAAGDCQIAQSRLFFVVLTVSMRARAAEHSPAAPRRSRIWFRVQFRWKYTQKNRVQHESVGRVLCADARVPGPAVSARVPTGTARSTARSLSRYVKTYIEASFRRSRLRAWRGCAQSHEPFV